MNPDELRDINAVPMTCYGRLMLEIAALYGDVVDVVGMVARAFAPDEIDAMYLDIGGEG